MNKSFVINEGSSPLSGFWKLRVDIHFQLLFKHTFDNIPIVRFCPYCGQKLPKMVLKKAPPQNSHLCTVTDGGYYCDTCNERLDACICDPVSILLEEES